MMTYDHLGCFTMILVKIGTLLGGLFLGVDAQKLTDAGHAIRELQAGDQRQLLLLRGPQRLLQEFLSNQFD